MKHENIIIIHKNLTTTLNFLVKPGDPQKELPSLPTIPTSLSEAWSLTSSIGRSAKTLILGESKESSNDSSSKVTFINIQNLGQNNEDVNTSHVSCTRNDFEHSFTSHNSNNVFSKSSDTSCSNDPSTIDLILSPGITFYITALSPTFIYCSLPC